MIPPHAGVEAFLLAAYGEMGVLTGSVSTNGMGCPAYCDEVDASTYFLTLCLR